MEDLQTDTLSDYAKSAENTGLNSKDNENACTANLLNGCDDIDDPLDLIDHCDNASIGSNSDVWKGSDSEDESFEKDSPAQNFELNKNMNADVQPTPTETAEDKGDSGQPEQEPQLNNENEETTAENKQKDAEENKEDTSVSIIENEDEIAKKIDDETKENEPETQESDPLTQNNENKDTTSNDAGEKTSVGDNKEELEANTVSGDKEMAETVNTEKEKSEQKEKDQSTNESVDRDSSIEEITEKDPLMNHTEEKDPLATDVVEVTESSAEAKKSDKNDEVVEDEDSQMDYNDDDDFDPSLLCPEVSMAVDESPVITNSGSVPGDGSSSPLPYEPVFSTFVDEVTGAEISFNLTAEEQELRKRLYGPSNPIQYSKIHCTACNVHLGSALEGQNNRFVHPLLKVLICKECYHFYTSGEFEKDEDGSELYCRWCGQGGQVLCCSKCEFVFCKRCIRTNFGRKKMFEIRDSDNWDCFRCSPNQIITQRVACYEFFEYVRREMARTIGNPEMWSKDYSHCCSMKKRLSEGGEEVRKPKRRRGDVDPDYTPVLDKIDSGKMASGQATATPTTSAVKSQPYSPAIKGIVLPKPIQLVSKIANKNKDNDIEFVRAIPAPQVAINPVRVSVPQYRTILPSNVRPVLQPPTVVRINSQSLPPLVPTQNRVLSSALQGQRTITQPSMMKHEWFEKTVRAAARVNSHLSYTLTQLNKAQTQAASVEELAVVHNKLQEILSSSINSLIQIRKNLRTEFIAGIKTVRLPSKKPPEPSNDDDVIFVSAPTTMPAPTPSTSKTSDPIVIIDKSKSKSTESESAKELVARLTSERPRLKVKSVSELQNVPSECITIPDDTPTLKKVEDVKEGEKKVEEKEGNKEEKEEGKVEEKVDNSKPAEVVCNGTAEKPKTPEPELNLTSDKGDKEETNNSDPTPENSSEKEVTIDVSAVEVSNEKKEEEVSVSKSEISENTSPETTEPPAKKHKLEVASKENNVISETRTRKSRSGESRGNKIFYNIKDEPTKEIKRMLSVTVNLPRVDLEELKKRLPNGCH